MVWNDFKRRVGAWHRTLYPQPDTAMYEVILAKLAEEMQELHDAATPHDHATEYSDVLIVLAVADERLSWHKGWRIMRSSDQAGGRMPIVPDVTLRRFDAVRERGIEAQRARDRDRMDPAIIERLSLD